MINAKNKEESVKELKEYLEGKWYKGIVIQAGMTHMKIKMISTMVIGVTKAEQS
ncbi:hypothetical protein LQK80_15985 [Bacillus thuringiensis]|nr:hypothetical protein [Bacillus thuringiensis]